MEGHKPLIKYACHRYTVGRCFICFGLAGAMDLICRPCWDTYHKMCVEDEERKRNDTWKLEEFAGLLDISLMMDRIGYPDTLRVGNIIKHGPMRRRDLGE